MGLAPLIVGLESPGLRRNDETLHQFGTFLGKESSALTSSWAY
jgi:hypothetical protein